MDERFKKYVESLEPVYLKLIEMEPVVPSMLPTDIPKSGVYLFSEGYMHLFVGRSDRLRTRLQEHCRPSSNHNTAPFAFKIARVQTGKIEASYTSDGSRSDLENNPAFLEAFDKAKERIRSMDVRFVEEVDPVKQMLLVIYISVALNTKYNEFRTH